MAATQSIKAGRAFVELFADDSKLARGLKSAQKKLEAFGSGIKHIGTRIMAAGAAITAPLVAAAKSYGDMGEHLTQMAARTGVSVEALSALSYAAQMSGTSIDDLENGLRKMQKNLYDAAASGRVTTADLHMLGLTVADIRNLSPEEQFKLIADRISQITNPTKRAAAAMAFFGKTGTTLLPLMAGGAAGIEAYMKEAQALGIVMSTEDAEAALMFHESLKTLGMVLKSLVNTIGSALGPTLTEAVQWITNVVASAKGWAKENKDLILTVFKVAVGVSAAGAAITGIGYAISAVGSIFGGLATAVHVVHGIFSALAPVIAALISPIGLVVVGITGLVAAGLYAAGGLDECIQWIGEGFAGLVDDTKATFQAIGNALASGDIAAAAKVLWAYLQMEWAKGTGALEKAWADFRGMFIKIGYSAFYGVVALAEVVWHGLEVGWIEMTNFLSQTWTSFCSAVQKAWSWTTTALTKAWNTLRALFDKNFNAKTANAAADQAYEAGIKKIEEEKKAKLAGREAQRKQEREDSAKVHDATMDQIQQEWLKSLDEVDAETKKRVDESQKAVDDAKAQWQKAIQDANAPAEKKPGRNLDDLKKRMAAGVDPLKAELDRTTSRGTFNAAALSGLAGGPADRIAAATEETAKNTRLIKKITTGQVPFL